MLPDIAQATRSRRADPPPRKTGSRKLGRTTKEEQARLREVRVCIQDAAPSPSACLVGNTPYFLELPSNAQGRWRSPACPPQAILLFGPDPKWRQVALQAEIMLLGYDETILNTVRPLEGDGSSQALGQDRRRQDLVAGAEELRDDFLGKGLGRPGKTVTRAIECMSLVVYVILTSMRR